MDVGVQAQSPSLPYQHKSYASYIVLRKVGRNNAVSYCPSTEDLNIPDTPALPHSQRNRKTVYGCKHFPEIEADVVSTWSCEFCRGAKLIEEAARSNADLWCLDIDELLHNYSAQLSSNYYTGNETARLSSNYCTGNEMEQLSSIYDTGAETVEEMPTPAECTLPPKSLWSQPSTALQERQEDGTVAAVPSSNDGVSLPLDSVEYERMSMSLSACGSPAMEVDKTCETPRCSSTQRGMEIPREQPEPHSPSLSGTDTGTGSCCEWSSDCTEISSGLSDARSLSWDSSGYAGPASPNDLYGNSSTRGNETDPAQTTIVRWQY